MSELKAIRSGEIYNIIEYEDCYRTDDLYYPKSEADKVIEELQEKILVLEKSYKKLMKKFVHEASVAESYRSLIYKEDALNEQEKGDSVNYELLSKKSDNCYRHANRWRGIFKNLNEDK